MPETLVRYENDVNSIKTIILLFLHDDRSVHHQARDAKREVRRRRGVGTYCLEQTVRVRTVPAAAASCQTSGILFSRMTINHAGNSQDYLWTRKTAIVGRVFARLIRRRLGYAGVVVTTRRSVVGRDVVRPVAVPLPWWSMRRTIECSPCR